MREAVVCQPLQDVLFGCSAFIFIGHGNDKALLVFPALQQIAVEQFHLRAIHEGII
jgi:hypothetical protein